jgi:hypothetical protein
MATSAQNETLVATLEESPLINEFDNVVAGVLPLPRSFGLRTNFSILLHDGSVLKTDWLTDFDSALATATAGDRLWFSVAPGGKLLKVRVIARQVQGYSRKISDPVLGELTESRSGFTGHNRI